MTELDPLARGGRRFAGRICVVTGAGQGIGRATARRLAAEGGTVVVAERVRQTAAETVRILRDAGAEAREAVYDVSTPDGARALMEAAVAAYGRIDVLVNVVGGTIWWKRYHLYTVEETQLELERSLYTTLWCSHAVLPIMVEQRSGTIVNLSSSVTRGGLYRVPYAVAKGGIEALTRTLAAEYGPSGIRVNAVRPGSTAITDRVTSRLQIREGVVAEAAPVSEEAIADSRRHLEEQAIARQGTPEEQAATIAFLASDDAGYITGQIVDCLGGP